MSAHTAKTVSPRYPATDVVLRRVKNVRLAFGASRVVTSCPSATNVAKETTQPVKRIVLHTSGTPGTLKVIPQRKYKAPAAPTNQSRRLSGMRSTRAWSLFVLFMHLGTVKSSGSVPPRAPGYRRKMRPPNHRRPGSAVWPAQAHGPRSPPPPPRTPGQAARPDAACRRRTTNPCPPGDSHASGSSSAHHAVVAHASLATWPTMRDGWPSARSGRCEFASAGKGHGWISSGANRRAASFIPARRSPPSTSSPPVRRWFGDEASDRPPAARAALGLRRKVVWWGSAQGQLWSLASLPLPLVSDLRGVVRLVW